MSNYSYVKLGNSPGAITKARGFFQLNIKITIIQNV